MMRKIDRSMIGCKVMNAARTKEFRRRLFEERERIVTEWAAHGGASGSGDEWESRNMDRRR